MFKTFMEWQKLYGNTFGYYEGPTPVIVSSDLTFLQEIFLTKFNNFRARKKYPVQADPVESEDVHMFFAQGERWKRLRSIMTPAFTASKLKQLTPLLHDRLDDVERSIEEYIEINMPFNIYGLLQRLTLDTILNCGFGIESDAVKNPNDIYLQKCRGILADTTRWPLFYLVAFTFPSWNRLWFLVYTWLGELNGNPVNWMNHQIASIIDHRKRHREDRIDLLQIMLDSECKSVSDASHQWAGNLLSTLPITAAPQDLSESRDVHDLTMELKTDDECGLSLTKLKVLSPRELAAQCFVFLLAGYETTSTSLSYVVFELTQHPDVQERLQAEIDELDCTRPSYETLQKLRYLDMVWKESLRMYPSASNVIARECVETCEVAGVHIPKGTIVQANVWAVHHDPLLWGAEPNKFNPERFTHENCRHRNSLSWMPFGAGYRNCIGARFAIMEAKLALVRILMKYSFLACSETPSKLELIEGATITPKNGVVVMLKRRK